MKINIKTLCTHVFFFIFSNILNMHSYIQLKQVHTGNSLIQDNSTSTIACHLSCKCWSIMVGVILFSKRNYISREINKCASTVAPITDCDCGFP